MGADTFVMVSRGKTAQEAFQSARDEALYEYGHRGYTGTIAEKHSFTMIPLKNLTIEPSKSSAALSAVSEKEARKYADRLIDEDDPRISDKWGPAGCIYLGGDRFLFFGWASS